jgi:hypothetical protein
MNTSSTAPGATRERSSAALIANAPRSAAEKHDSEPWKEPMGVRTAAAMHTSAVGGWCVFVCQGGGHGGRVECACRLTSQSARRHTVCCAAKAHACARTSRSQAGAVSHVGVLARLVHLLRRRGPPAKRRCDACRCCGVGRLLLAVVKQARQQQPGAPAPHQGTPARRPTAGELAHACVCGTQVCVDRWQSHADACCDLIHAQTGQIDEAESSREAEQRALKMYCCADGCQRSCMRIAHPPRARRRH